MRSWIAFAALAVAACTTMAAENPPAEHGATPGYTCRNEGLDAYVGREATAEVGAEIRSKSGAKVLRWLQPGQIVTMEFRSDRVNVHLDAKNRIARINCG